MGAEFSVEHPVMADPANQSHRPWPALTRFPCFASIPWVDPIRENQVNPPGLQNRRLGHPAKHNIRPGVGAGPFALLLLRIDTKKNQAIEIGITFRAGALRILRTVFRRFLSWPCLLLPTYRLLLSLCGAVGGGGSIVHLEYDRDPLTLD
jgi:hypothetical protein